ncbi:MAG: photosynthetic reaction center subunit H, partial [Pseudomonadota bacterium]
LEPTSGTPYEPTGNPMLDGIGPGAYAERADVPDVTLEGEVKIVPLRAAEGFELAKRDPNPIGMEVVGCDKEVGGTITDVWVDKSERMIRFYEVAPADGAEGDRVLLPVNFAVFRRWRSRGNNQLYVHAITGSQFAHVPQTKKPDEVTMLEEEKVFGYFGGGLLYATPRRVGPALL